MLSKDLSILHRWFDEIITGGAEFTIEGATTFRAALDRAATDARALEELAAQALPFDGRAERELAAVADVMAARGDNVVPFRRRAPFGVPFSDGGAA